MTKSKRPLRMRAAAAARRGQCKLAGKLIRKAKRSAQHDGYTALSASIVARYCPDANLGSARKRKRKKR